MIPECAEHYYINLKYFFVGLSLIEKNKKCFKVIIFPMCKCPNNVF